MAPTAASLLRAWEAGAASAPVDRAPLLLRWIGAVAADAPAGDLTVGQCDALLFEARRALFGETLEATATCPACQTEVELTVALGDLQPPVTPGPVAPVTVQADGYALQCRIPGHEDLRALAGRREATLRDLLERCVLEARSPAGQPVTPGELPDATVDAVATALAEADPGAQTVLRVRCPCGTEWLDELDIQAVVWNDLTEWVGYTLTEVHLLAQAYGWSEAEILGLSGWRRSWYLEAAGW